MSNMFWVAGAAMTVIALSFLVAPFVLQKKKITATAWMIAFAVPALAIGLYVTLGRPAAANFNAAHQSRIDAVPGKSSAQQAGKNIGSVSSMLIGLEQRLENEPADAKGWLLLAKSYAHLGRAGDATAAYEKARNLGQIDSDFESKLSGLSSDEHISPIIRGRLTIADVARGRLDPDDSIFIFAKSTDGTAMPVAVLRRTASDLPFDFELSDKQAMSPAANLSATNSVTITARISKTGNAMLAEPGMEVISQPIKVGDSDFIELHIDPTVTSDES